MYRLVLPLVLLVNVCLAQEIRPGSKAPPLDIKTWYKGDPIPSLLSNKIYVIEFWATWCGPCIAAMPHISQLAKDNPDATFIGVGIWEEDKDGVIKKFVDEMGDKMAYRVGYSGTRTNGMAITWMDASAQIGIPATFIVKDGIIQWIGHPMRMGKPLADIKAGKFDLPAFQKEFGELELSNRQYLASRPTLAKIRQLLADGKYDQAKPVLDAAYKQYPKGSRFFDMLDLPEAQKKDAERWGKLAQRIISSQDPTRISNLIFHCSMIAEDKVNALRAKDVVNAFLRSTSNKDSYLLYCAGHFFSRIGDQTRAVKLVDEALLLYPLSKYSNEPDIQKEMIDLRDHLRKTKSIG